MPNVHKIAPCLWFDSQAEETANFYVSIFPDSRIVRVARYSDAGRAIHKRPAGSVMTVDYELSGEPFTALNGGPLFKFNEAMSLQVLCHDQKEVDYYWDQLGKDGDPRAKQCGWLKDRFGVSWQVVPVQLIDMLLDHKSASAKRAMEAMLEMKKLDIAAMKRAYEG